MNQTIFVYWFNKIFFIGCEEQFNRKRLTILQHQIGQLKFEDENITCHFSPANITSLIQSMDQGFKDWSYPVFWSTAWWIEIIMDLRGLDQTLKICGK